MDGRNAQATGDLLRPRFRIMRLVQTASVNVDCRKAEWLECFISCIIGFHKPARVAKEDEESRRSEPHGTPKTQLRTLWSNSPPFNRTKPSLLERHYRHPPWLFTRRWLANTQSYICYGILKVMYKGKSNPWIKNPCNILYIKLSCQSYERPQ